MTQAFIRQVRAHEGEVVEIGWQLNDGTSFYQRLTIPPKATRDAVHEKRAAVRAVDRLEPETI